MKNKKILNLISATVIFAALAFLFAVSAIGNSNDIYTPLEALEALELIPDMENDDKISRIDALSALLSIMGEQSNASGFKGTPCFSDTKDPIASYAHVMGIIHGDDVGFFSPNRYVNAAEMLTMCLRALGENDITNENVYDLALSNELYTYTDDDNLFFYLTAEKMGEMLWNMMLQTPKSSNISYAERLIELAIIDSDLFTEITEHVEYTFGDVTRASTGCIDRIIIETETVTDDATTEPPVSEDTTKPSPSTTTKENEDWSPIWRPK